MYKGKKILAIVPAKKNSRGIPGKNLKRLHKKPLIQWTLDAAMASKYIDEAVISTDDRKIGEFAFKRGASFPVLRPKKFATATAKSSDVILHMMDYYQKVMQKPFDLVMMLQPTSPLRTARDIDNAVRYFFQHRAKALISFCKASVNPCWMATANKDRTYSLLMEQKPEYHQRQGLPVFYQKNGAIYIALWKYFIKARDFETPQTLLYEMDSLSSVDLDLPEDWDLAEYLIKRNLP